MSKAPLASKSHEYLPKDMGLLRSEIEKLPSSLRERMLPMCDKLSHFMCLQGRLFEVAQEAVDRLQLEARYLLFDLDCTRHERDELRIELENLTEGWQ